MPKPLLSQEYLLPIKPDAIDIYRLERACVDCNVVMREASSKGIRFTGSSRCIRKFISWVRKEQLVQP